MIEAMRTYIATCPYLDEFTALNVDYLIDKIKAYSLNEQASYNPVVNKNLDGTKSMQFICNFDAKLYWNEEIQNNIDNSVFFENFRDWLEENDENNIYPDINGIIPECIEATTNGYIFIANADEAIYRINIRFTYEK